MEKSMRPGDTIAAGADKLKKEGQTKAELHKELVDYIAARRSEGAGSQEGFGLSQNQSH